MVQNIGNTMDELIDKKRPKKVEINLGEFADKAKFYYKGEKVEKKLSEVMQTKQQLQQNAAVSSTTTASDQKIEQESQEGAQ